MSLTTARRRPRSAVEERALARIRRTGEDDQWRAVRLFTGAGAAEEALDLAHKLDAAGLERARLDGDDVFLIREVDPRFDEGEQMHGAVGPVAEAGAGFAAQQLVGGSELVGGCRGDDGADALGLLQRELAVQVRSRGELAGAGEPEGAVPDLDERVMTRSTSTGLPGMVSSAASSPV
jgi:hypothetical protein